MVRAKGILIPVLHKCVAVSSDVAFMNRRMELKIINRTIAVLIILTNVYFIPLNYVTIRDAGGPMGFGLLALPILLSTNLLLINAGLTLKSKYKENILLFCINAAGLIWNLFWLWLLLTTPKMD